MLTVHLTPLACFLQLKPDKVYYVGGFGVLSKWLPVNEYEVCINRLLARCRCRLCAVLAILYWTYILNCDSWTGVANAFGCVIMG